MSDSSLPEWLDAITTARTPRPKSAEIIAAMDDLLAREAQSIRATAACSGGVYDAGRVRRYAAAEAGMGTLERLAGVFGDLSAKHQKAILGDGR